jgi:hypothetical protein
MNANHTFRTFTAAVAIALAVASAPAFAKSRVNQAGYAARAQATEIVIEEGTSVSPKRAEALRECTTLAESSKVYSLVPQHLAVYRGCMYRHGERE